MTSPRTVSGTGFTGPGKRLADSSPGPWKSWRRMSRTARAIRFIETYCRPPKGVRHGQPLRLGKFQKDWLEQALAEGIDVAVLETPRGNGKSTFGGALATWAVFDDDATGAPQVPIIATTVGQAVRSCYGVAVSMVRAEPELLNRALIYTGISTPRVSVPFNDGELFPISNDPDGLQGLDPSLGIVDEIGFQPVASWDSLQLAQGKRERSLVCGLGTPGLDDENALHYLRTLVHEGAELPGTVFVEYAAPEACDIDDQDAWRTGNPAIGEGFLSIDALKRARARTQETPFRIFRLGQWVRGVESWLGPNAAVIWEGLTNPYEFDPEVPSYVGIDIAIKSDTSAVVIMQRRPDGRYYAECRIWRPTPDRAVDVTDIMQYLRELHDRLSVESFSFDPRFFDVPAKMLSDEGLPMWEVAQSIEHMTPAYVSLYSAVTEGRITHDGDPAFATQVLNAVPRYTDRGFTLEKRKSKGKIDAAVALCLAYDRALRIEQPEPSVYEERGLVTFG